MIEKLRLFLTILEEGSLRRAAERCHIAQSAITRQIQLLEHDLGGRVLERTSAGVRPTSGGHALAEKARTLLADYDSAMAEVRRLVRGESDRLRIGYIASAVQEYLGLALVELRRRYPELKIKMLDQTPAEMITGCNHSEHPSKCNLWIRPPSLIIRLSRVDTRVLDFLMILFHICQQVCRHPVMFACSLDVRAAGKCPEAGDGQD